VPCRPPGSWPGARPGAPRLAGVTVAGPARGVSALAATRCSVHTRRACQSEGTVSGDGDAVTSVGHVAVLLSLRLDTPGHAGGGPVPPRVRVAGARDPIRRCSVHTAVASPPEGSVSGDGDLARAAGRPRRQVLLDTPPPGRPGAGTLRLPSSSSSVLAWQQSPG
jgi:hypothetical protein